MATRFEGRLQDALRNFNLQDALDLSDEINLAEANEGYEVTRREDQLWLQLTSKIETEREKARKAKR